MKDIMGGMNQQHRQMKKAGTRVSRSFNRVTEHINSNGDIIDPITKEILKRNSGPDRDE